MTVRPAKTRINLGIRSVWSESSLCSQLVTKDPSFLHADSEDSDQTGRMPRLIWVFAGRTCQFVGFVMLRLIYPLSLFLVGVCVLSLDAGEGIEIVEKFYYDKSSDTCRRFTYKGTKGNDNNFQSKDRCEVTCRPFSAEGKEALKGTLQLYTSYGTP